MSFKVERVKAGKKAKEVAEYMGVSVTTVSQWENGVFYPTVDKLPKIAAFYGCTVDELLAPEKADMAVERFADCDNA